mmetsp:Transcript_48822/g.153290  ORF Transcript_48822/g.153290 Transcript_48822/m.153290 type:complete len:96 (+) Transcript_48822:1403-1690(+)
MKQRGGTVDISDLRGQTPLHYASAYGNYACINVFSRYLSEDKIRKLCSMHDKYNQRFMDYANDPRCRAAISRLLAVVLPTVSSLPIDTRAEGGGR